ncbi:MAG: hypothetical protein AVO35_10560 [Candidatus Aegiribacteria sp. MLS_C]|nr:MAG: hypothetical protein AVO35_10560 [Candidatus Aegiribacteria sp. MLS_C]
MILEARGIEETVITMGIMLIGLVLAVSAAVQLARGGTWGATGRGRVYRNASPAYFWYLFVARVILGVAMIAVSAVVLT